MVTLAHKEKTNFSYSIEKRRWNNKNRRFKGKNALKFYIKVTENKHVTTWKLCTRTITKPCLVFTSYWSKSQHLFLTTPFIQLTKVWNFDQGWAKKSSKIHFLITKRTVLAQWNPFKRYVILKEKECMKSVPFLNEMGSILFYSKSV